jgi:hypothetical protein
MLKSMLLQINGLLSSIYLKSEVCTKSVQRSAKCNYLKHRSGSPAWIRTTIHGSKGRCPTIRRPGNIWNGIALPVYPSVPLCRNVASSWLYNRTRKAIWTGVRGGLQNRSAAVEVAGVFDSHCLPPPICKMCPPAPADARTAAGATALPDVRGPAVCTSLQSISRPSLARFLGPPAAFSPLSVRRLTPPPRNAEPMVFFSTSICTMIEVAGHGRSGSTALPAIASLRAHFGRLRPFSGLATPIY